MMAGGGGLLWQLWRDRSACRQDIALGLLDRDVHKLKLVPDDLLHEN